MTTLRALTTIHSDRLESMRAMLTCLRVGVQLEPTSILERPSL